MVLSNKKLKQKLRATLAIVESIADSGSGSNNIPQTTVPKISDLSLKEAQQQLRLSKREKRRKLRSSGASGDSTKIQADEKSTKGNEVKPSNEAVGDGGERSEKRKKKRKRGQVETEESGGGGGDGEVKKMKKKNAKNKKKWGKKNEKTEKKSDEAAKNEEEVKTAAAATTSSASADSTQVDNGNDRRKVYVGGIPYYSSEDDIRSYFESCGTITELDCMMFPESGKFRGIAIITFKTEEAAKRALAHDGADMGGLFLKIQSYNKPTTTRGGNSKAVAASSSNFVPPVVEGYNRIYMGNLSWDITEDDLRKFLSGCNISSIRFGIDKVTGEFRGYAHAEFSDSLSMNMAMKLDQQILCGRPVKVTSAIPKNNINPQFSNNTTAAAAAVAPITTTAVTTTTSTTDVGAAAAVGTDFVSNGDAVAVNNEPIVSSGKMRRRTCYVCGEKGHISSACPQKPADDPTNSTAALNSTL